MSTNVCMKQRSYTDTIDALSGLISNALTLRNREDREKEKFKCPSETLRFVNRTGIKLTDLEKLNVIHVAGTKGKGSTSTYIDAILSKSGYKTGLFTSPHLIEVQERIRLNGLPIEKSYFTSMFWKVYDKLEDSKESAGDMPFYFQFLTVMAINVFIDQKVDFVILETGIGGRFDCTNFIPNPKLSCITSIGYDHMEILGYTLNEIAWNKAGIIKENCPVITCDNQYKDVFNVITDEADQQNSQLMLVPISPTEDLLSISESGGVIHKENCAIAIAACKYLLYNQQPHESSDCENKFQKIIQSTSVIGRYKVIQHGAVRYLIDGAHTVESIKTTTKWMKLLHDKDGGSKKRKKFLVFMITGKRNPDILLEELVEFDFDALLLSPIIPYISTDFHGNQDLQKQDQLKISQISSSWKRVTTNHGQDDKPIKLFDCFHSIFNWLANEYREPINFEVDVLVVGSLHLAGCSLEVLGKQSTGIDDVN